MAFVKGLLLSKSVENRSVDAAVASDDVAGLLFALVDAMDFLKGLLLVDGSNSSSSSSNLSDLAKPARKDFSSSSEPSKPEDLLWVRDNCVATDRGDGRARRVAGDTGGGGMIGIIAAEVE